MDSAFDFRKWDEDFPRLIGLLTAATAAMVEIGWAFDLSFLKVMLLGTVAMNPLTALLFLVGGLSLNSHFARRRDFTLFGGIFIAGLGAACALRPLAIDLPIDRLLFVNSLDGNRMAPNTALAFVFLGASIASLGRLSWRGFRWSDVLSLVSLLMGMVAITGYFYGAGSLYGVKGFIPMAFMTGLNFTLLSLGILFTEPSDGVGEILLRKDFGGRVARGLFPAMILIPAVLGWLELVAVRAELVPAEVGAAFRSVALMLVLTVLVGWMARSLSRTHAIAHKHSQVMESVLHCMGDGVVVADAAGAILIKNSAADRILGLSQHEFGELRDALRSRVFTADGRSPADPTKFPLTQALRGREIDDSEYFVRNVANEDGVFISISGRPVVDEEGAAQGGLVVIRDVTERRMREISLRDANVELERYAAERVNELRKTEEQVIQLQKTDAVGRLAGGVAHDFNNLLAAINMYCDLLIDDAADPSAVRETAEDVRKVAWRGAALTRQLLVFSRKQVVSAQLLQLNELVTDLKKMLDRLLPANVTLTTKLTAAPTVRADAGQIEQVFMNLVLNARDAMPDGGKITVETGETILDETFAGTHLSVTPGRHSVLTVTDTGVGMSAETKARLFEPFFTTKPVGKGTGLGLATVYGIVKQLRGSIWVYGEEGKGSIFKIYIPAAAEDEVAVESAAPSIPLGTTPGSGRILLVEDDDALRDLFSGLLRRNGYQVFTCLNGADAVEKCRDRLGEFDLLLTDMMMPGMTGPELARVFRQVKPGLKILFMSGYVDAEKTEAVGDGSPILQKPFNAGMLLEKIKDVLRG